MAEGGSGVGVTVAVTWKADVGGFKLPVCNKLMGALLLGKDPDQEL
jgi:hypothetical protein